jgi:hypothetical protein
VLSDLGLAGRRGSGAAEVARTAAATTTNQGVTGASGKPCSAMVGASGKYFERPSLMAPMIQIDPFCTCATGKVLKRELRRPFWENREAPRWAKAG